MIEIYLILIERLIIIGYNEVEHERCELPY